MRPHGRDDGREDRRLRLRNGSEAAEADVQERRSEVDLVFDFTDLHHPEFRDLSLILTARLQGEPGDRVWMRALPASTWRVLHALGLGHLFRPYPGPSAEPN